ncbi:Pumilio 24 [Tetrabaena socialis]|uniref:Pumilio 24 n=1 Tax=Tetrabaena socialis TaxID=47790 RepID=A0A2J8AJV4_9CHLO|nr:Pumilio 24 [Tetrabaena socialis]|eukprot:PNH12802.1 Pumilio 24 [Tetrabaena socialis]
MASKVGKAAPPSKGIKPIAKPGSKRKGDAAPAAPAPIAKRPRTSDGGAGGSDASKKSTKDKRAVIREKKLLHKKNWDVIQDSVYLWEKLRPKETSEPERQELVSSILRKVSGKLLELSNHHTASRVIQFCVKYGGEGERRKVMEEVRANILELSKSKYGHFLVRKLVNTAKKEDVPGLVRHFRGHVAQLLRQPYAADVITDLYDVASTSDRNTLCSEFYGKEFVLFDGLSGEAGRLHSLKQLMAGVAPAKQRAIIQHMSKSLMPIMEKALLHPPITHRLVKDYLDCATGMTVESAVETLSATGEAVLRMVHTHEGAAAACMVLAYGTPRDRKRVVRAMKGHVPVMAADEWGHAALCMALGCVDDTALTGKVVAELKDLLPQGINQAHFVRVMMQLLAPSSRRHFPPAIHEMLHPPQRTVRGSTGKSVTSIDGEEDEDAEFEASAAALEAADDGDDLFEPKKGKDGSAGKGKGKGKKQRQADVKGKGSKAAGEAPGGKTAGAGGEEEADGAPAEQAPGVERVLGASKKDAKLRRQELLGSGPKSLSAALTAKVAENAVSLVRSANGCELVVEVARGGDQGLLYELQREGVESVHAALVADAARTAEDVAGAGADDDEPLVASTSQEHILLGYFSSRALRRLLLSAAEEQQGGAAAFAAALWEGAFKGRCKQWVGTHAEKVLAALLHCGVAAVAQAAAKELKPLVKQPLEEWASPFLKAGGDAPVVAKPRVPKNKRVRPA